MKRGKNNKSIQQEETINYILWTPKLKFRLAIPQIFKKKKTKKERKKQINIDKIVHSYIVGTEVDARSEAYSHYFSSRTASRSRERERESSVGEWSDLKMVWLRNMQTLVVVLVFLLNIDITNQLRRIVTDKWPLVYRFNRWHFALILLLLLLHSVYTQTPFECKFVVPI